MDLTDDAIDASGTDISTEVQPIPAVQSRTITPNEIDTTDVGISCGDNTVNISTHVAEASRSDATLRELDVAAAGLSDYERKRRSDAMLRELDIAEAGLSDYERKRRRDVLLRPTKNTRVVFRTITNSSKTPAEEEELVGVAGPSGVSAKRKKASPSLPKDMKKRNARRTDSKKKHVEVKKRKSEKKKKSVLSQPDVDETTIANGVGEPPFPSFEVS